jgi:hypothetical protein
LQRSAARVVRFVLLSPEADAAGEPASAALARLEVLQARLAAGWASLAGAGEVALELAWTHRPGRDAPFYRELLGRQASFLGAAPGRVSNSLRIGLRELPEALGDEAEGGPAFDAVEVLVGLCEQREGPEEEALAGERIADAWARLREARPAPLRTDFATVLSRRNHARVEEIVRAYERSGIGRCRLIPLHREPTLLPPYGARDELTATEVVAALQRAAELSLASGAATRLEPIRRLVRHARALHDPRVSFRFHDRRSWEQTYLVNGRGEVFGRPEAGDGGPAYGDLLHAPLQQIVTSAAHQRSIAASERRMAAACAPCRFYGVCTGGPVAEAPASAGPACAVVRPMLELVERRLCAGGEAPRRPSVAPAALDAHEPAPAALRPGVSVRFATEEAAGVASRFLLSAGTIAASARPGPRYHVGALVPAEPWRSPTAAELSVLAAPGSRDGAAWRRAEDVAVLALPQDVLSPLASICEQCGLYDPDPAAAGSPTRHRDWERAQRALAEHLRPWRLEDRPIDATVVYRSEPGLTTVTRIDRGKPDEEVHVGLHVDSWEGVSLRGRERVRNRICVNLSRRERHFLFVNQTLPAMMRTLGLADSDDLEPLSLFAGHRFLRRHPTYPVVKLTIRPGEAYVAPTGNVVHDGGSAPGREPDVALHLLGYFVVPGAAAGAENPRLRRSAATSGSRPRKAR